MGYKRVNYEKTKELCHLIFQSYGFTPEESVQITDILLGADLFGVESHGLQRITRYYNDLRLGFVDPKAKLEIIHESPISATIDAHQAMGQLAGYEGMKLAIEKAKKSGIGMVTICNSNHYGIAGYYANMAIKEDLLGISMTNSASIMVPTYGKRPMLGTNPIAIGMPADPTPFLFDAATTVVARGKIEVKNKKGEELPVGFAVDENGNTCTDAKRALDCMIQAIGGILPLGGDASTSGYKGYGYGMLVELMTGILAGGVTSNKNVNNGKDRVVTSHFFMAIDYSIFGDKAAIKERMSTYMQELRDCPKADGQDRVYTHGEKEFESTAERIANGLIVNDKTFDEIKMVAKACGIDYVPYIGE